MNSQKQFRANIAGSTRVFNLIPHKIDRPNYQLFDHKSLLASASNNTSPASSKGAKVTSTSCDLRPFLPACWDQGNLGSCTSFACTALFIMDDPKWNPSQLFHYYNERVLDKTVNFDAGSTITTGMKALKQYGVCNSNTWPYVISKYRTKPLTNAYREAMNHQVLECYNVQQTLDQIKACLLSGEPIAFGFLVYNSFLSIGKDGMMPMPKKGDYVIGGHAVVIVGFDDAKQCFIVRNSWGSKWADRGHFYMPYNYMTNKNLASDLWKVTRIEK